MLAQNAIIAHLFGNQFRVLHGREHTLAARPCACRSLHRFECEPSDGSLWRTEAEVYFVDTRHAQPPAQLDVEPWLEMISRPAQLPRGRV